MWFRMTVVDIPTNFFNFLGWVATPFMLWIKTDEN